MWEEFYFYSKKGNIRSNHILFENTGDYFKKRLIRFCEKIRKSFKNIFKHFKRILQVFYVINIKFLWKNRASFKEYNSNGYMLEVKSYYKGKSMEMLENS